MAVIAAYLLGSVNFSLAAASLAGRTAELRASGSGNPGASNVMRAMGLRWAIPVLLLDVGRGAGVALAATTFIQGPWQPYAVCLSLILGNLFPLFHKFQGGKGIANSLGVFLGLDWLVALSSCAIWFAVALPSRYASAGSLAMMLAIPIGLHLHGAPTQATAFGAVIFVLTLFTHRSNISRLLKGQEKRLNSGTPNGVPGE